MSWRQLKTEMKSSNPRQQAMIKVFFLNAIATPEDYRLCRTATSIGGIVWPKGDDCPEAIELDSIDGVTWEFQEKHFNTGEIPLFGTAVVGMPDVARMMTGRAEVAAKWIRLITNSAGVAYWTLAAVGIWMLSVASGLLSWMDLGGWFDVEVFQWALCTKDKLNAARRTLTLEGQTHMLVDDALMLRKLPNIVARNKDEADWASEEHRRRVDTPVHMMPMPDGTLSRSKWLVTMYGYLQGFTDRVIGGMVSDMRLEDLDTWWSSRAAWAPQGSSNNSKAAVAAVEADLGSPLPAGARANKRTVAVTLEDDHVHWTMLGLPVKKPRRSTKNEPGLKNRALFAQDDSSFFVSSYASVAMEKSINIDGIYAQQSPDDVATWVRNHQRDSALGCCFLSLDYSDYNAEHELTALAMVDACMAVSWSKLGGGTKLSREKAAACVWAAKAHLNSWVDFGNPEGAVRINSGLFSGDRNTSRDNCILHAVYSNAMQWAARQILPEFSIVNIAMTGDDEDASFIHWVDALLYMSLHAQAGFVLKVAKQLSGSAQCPTHEYLQRALTTDARPSRPLAAALAQVMSGNWYKDQYIWFDGVIQSVTSNCWELHTRGVPIWISRQLAAIVLNRVMQVKRSGQWVKLEWWSYRTCGKWDPLWDTTTPPAPEVPTGEDAILGPTFAHGMTAWRRKNADRFGRFLPAAKLDRYMLAVSKEVYGCLWPKERNALMHSAAAEIWPERTENWNQSLDKNTAVKNRRVNQVILARLLENEIVERQPTTEAQLASKFGLDTNMLLALGGWKAVLRMFPPEDMQHWTSVVQPIAPPKWASAEDPAIRSWLSTAFAAHKDIGSFSLSASKQQKDVTVVLAGNGSGKTTFKLSQADGSVVDMDNLFSHSGINKWLKNNPSARNKALPLGLVLDAAKRLTDDPPEMLMTQYPPNLVLPILKEANLHINRMYVVESNELMMWERTTMSRAWQITKCQRRQERFMTTVEAWCTRTKQVIRKVTNIQCAWSDMTNYQKQ